MWNLFLFFSFDSFLQVHMDNTVQLFIFAFKIINSCKRTEFPCMKAYTEVLKAIMYPLSSTHHGQSSKVLKAKNIYLFFQILYCKMFGPVDLIRSPARTLHLSFFHRTFSIFLFTQGRSNQIQIIQNVFLTWFQYFPQ